MPTLSPRILIYLLRRDLRLTDNPVFHEISKVFTSSPSPPFTHLLPIYVYSAQHIDLSGFLPRKPTTTTTTADKDTTESPYPPPVSALGGFPRCGPHRAKFYTESVWDLRTSLRDIGSDLLVRVGMLDHVVRDAMDYLEGGGGGGNSGDGPAAAAAPRGKVMGVWMTRDEPVEERREERALRKLMEGRGREFRLFADDKYFIDDGKLPFSHIGDLPNIYTTFRQKLEPLRNQPVKPVRAPTKLPPFPAPEAIGPQSAPFEIPDAFEELLSAVMAPFADGTKVGLRNPPGWPEGTGSVHPFKGGETVAQERVWHLLSTGAMTSYKDTRNGLLGVDFSTKMGAFLAVGCLSARWVHDEMKQFEGDGNGNSISVPPPVSPVSRPHPHSAPVVVVSSTGLSPERLTTLSTRNPKEAAFKARYRTAPGFNQGENAGTAGVRFELLWRDYMRLCCRKFGPKLFHLAGFVGSTEKQWKSAAEDGEKTKTVLMRFLEGRTGIGLIDAAQRELYLTGYASNRARQNVASFLAKHLGIDWRLGAEWYECMLVDYDCASNWGNWQYVAGVGNDPRQGRTFNPVKQALDYDGKGEFVKAWVPELRAIDTGRCGAAGAGAGGQQDQEALMGVFQAWRVPEKEQERCGISALEWVRQPLVRIPFQLKRTGRGPPRRGGGRGGGGGGGGSGRGRGGAGFARGHGRPYRGSANASVEAGRWRINGV